LQQKAGGDAVEGGSPGLTEAVELGGVSRVNVAVRVEEGNAGKLLQKSELLAGSTPSTPAQRNMMAAIVSPSAVLSFVDICTKACTKLSRVGSLVIAS
jgi:hypothetical protein